MRSTTQRVRRKRHLHPAASSCLLALPMMLLAAQVARPQRVPARSLGPLEATGSETFSQVRGFRELSDGRLLVTDQVEKKIVLLDLARHTAVHVGRQGPGPGEFEYALDLVAMPNDTTLLTDIGHGLDYLGIITADGRLEGSMKMPDGVNMSYVFGVDGSGHIYVSPTVYQRPGATAPDSVPVLRADVRRQSFDTAFFIARIPRGVNVPPNPFNPRHQWAVGPDGSIAIADVTDYHVTWIAPGGRRTTGAPIAFERLPFTQRDEDEFRDLARRVGGLGVSGASTSGRSAPPAVAFPSQKPPFFGNDAVRIAPNGELWVRRSQPAGARAPLHDIIDRTGRRVATITLPADTKLLALGERGIYLAHFDEDDVIRIERYRYP